MNLLLNVLLATPEPDPEFDETLVTPGPEGFTFIVIMAVAAIVLIIDMTRRIRRNTYRSIVQEELMAEAEAALKTGSQASEQTNPDQDQTETIDNDDPDAPPPAAEPKN